MRVGKDDDVRHIAGYVGDAVLVKRPDYRLYKERLKQLNALMAYCSEHPFTTAIAATLFENVEPQKKKAAA